MAPGPGRSPVGLFGAEEHGLATAVDKASLQDSFE